MKTGIICIETDFKVTTKSNRRNMDTESLLRFMHEGRQIPYIYRRVATKGELEYYLHQFSRPEYVRNFGIIYFSFHGSKAHSIYLEGDRINLTLNELAEIGGDVFKNRLVHFSSCFTMRGSSTVTEEFKNKTGAKLVSGYSKSVDTVKSAIHDICLFDSFIRYIQTPSIINRMEGIYGCMSKELGFKII